MKKNNLSDLERDLVEGLQEFLVDVKADAPISDKYTCRRVVLDLKPHTYSAEDVKATRKQLQASQGLFAQFLGVSVKTVRAWESGKRPSEMACRFMDEIQRNPEHWKARLLESAKVKTSQSE